MSCVMFAGQRKGLGFAMKNGDKVVAEGSVSVYERDGKDQLYARSITLEGAGLLYEMLPGFKKRAGSKLGCFPRSIKQPHTGLCKKVGIVHIATGQPFRISEILGRRNPYVQSIYPAWSREKAPKRAL